MIAKGPIICSAFIIDQGFIYQILGLLIFGDCFFYHHQELKPRPLSQKFLIFWNGQHRISNKTTLLRLSWVFSEKKTTTNPTIFSTNESFRTLFLDILVWHFQSTYLECYGRFANLSALMTARKNYHIKWVILGDGKCRVNETLVVNTNLLYRVNVLKT